jgi:SNF2 family DNA or RNA helicase
MFDYKKLAAMRRKQSIKDARGSGIMELDVWQPGRRSKPKLRLVYTPEFFDVACRLPTGRQCNKDQSYRYETTKEVWKALKPYLLAGLVVPTPGARKILQGLEREYLEHRIAIRRAEARFKFAEDSPVDLSHMRTCGYDHQARAVGFALTLDNSAMLMEQGTGKTWVGIAAAGYREALGQVKRLLVVTVKSQVYGWERQFKEHAGFEYCLSSSMGSGKLSAPTGPGLQVIVVNYHKARAQKDFLLKWKPDMVLADESQKIKNRRGKTSKVLTALSRVAKYKMILTGTPIGQSPQDVWAQYRFLEPSIFGSHFATFLDRYAIRGGYMGLEVKGYKNLGEFAEKCHSIAFRTTKAECLDLPEKLPPTNLYVEPDAATRRIYRELDLDFITKVKGQEIKVDRRIAALTKLRQITSGLMKTDGGILVPISKAKLSTLEEYLEDRDWSRKLVIFTVFNHEQDMIGDLLKKMRIKYLTLNGQTKRRDLVQESFQNDPQWATILVQTQAGGTGIDLFAADTVLKYSPAWSFLDSAQGDDRIHRIGQRYKCHYLNLVMRGTVDEDILAVLEEARSMADLLLDKRRKYRLKRSNLR